MKTAFVAIAAHRLFLLPRQVLVMLVRGYRLLLSAWLGSGCRFEPTCSLYSIQALEQRGALVGSYLTLRRLARCQPWCAGGHDPVPAPRASGGSASSLFTRLVPPENDRLSPSEKTSS